MSEHDKKREGDQLEISATVWNQLLDLLKKPQGQVGMSTPSIADFVTGLAGGATVEASSVLALDSWKLVALKGPQLTTEQGLMLDHTQTIEDASTGLAYSSTRSIDAYRTGSIGYKVGAKEATNVTVAGLVPADVLIHNDEHPCAEVAWVSGAAVYQSCWDGPHWILWKESGSPGSTRKTVLRLGQCTGRVLYGRATTNWKKTSGRPSANAVIGSHALQWGYVECKVHKGGAGWSSDTVKVLLPTGPGQDPNVETDQILPIARYHQDQPNFTNTGLTYNPNVFAQDYKYVAIGANHIDDAIGSVRLVLAGSGYTAPPGWKKIDGTQDTAKTLSGLAVDATDKFPRLGRLASEDGGEEEIEITPAEICDRIKDHPAIAAHSHSLPTEVIATGGEGPGSLGLSSSTTGTGGAISAQVHQPETEENVSPLNIIKEILPLWQGFTAIERFDNSAA